MPENSTPQTEDVVDIAPPPPPPSLDMAGENEESPADVQKPPKPKTTKRKARNKETADKATESMALDLDGYLEQWDWHQPHMVCKLVRTWPEFHQTVKTGGELEARPGKPFTVGEIRERFGGGEYEVRVIGPRNNRISQMLGHKKVNVPGVPRIDVLTKEAAGEQGRQGPGGSFDAMAPQAQAGLIGIVGDQLNHLREQSRSTDNGGASETLRSAYSEAAEISTRAAQGQLDAIREQSKRVEDDLHRRLSDQQQKLNQMEAERNAERQAWESRVHDAGSSQSALLQTLIPAAYDSSRQQVDQNQRATEQQIQRINDQHRSELEALHRHYAAAMDNQKTVFMMQDNTVQTTFSNQITLLQGQLQAATTKVDGLERENKQLRDSLLTMYMDQTKKQDPVAQLEQHAAILDVARSLGGMGGGEGLDEHAPSWMKLAEKAMPAITNIAEAAKARFAPGQPGQQYTPEQLAQIQAQQPAAAVQGQPSPQQIPAAAPQQAPANQPARVKPRQTVKIDPADLELAATSLTSAREAGTNPADAAKFAMSTLDQRMLRILIQQAPQGVVKELVAKGIITGGLASEDGQAYLVEFLVHLKGLFETIDAPPAAPAAPVATPAAPPETPAAPEAAEAPETTT